MSSVFRKSLDLNLKIEKFFSVISDGLSLFEKFMKDYFLGDLEGYNATFGRIKELEKVADGLEREITISLYQFMLLPDTRADVLTLIKSLDNIIDRVEETSKEIKVEKPVFPEAMHAETLKLVEQVNLSAEALLMAMRSFFNAVHLVGANINKVSFYEHESDLVEQRLLDIIFNGDICKDLAEKLYLKSYVLKIAWIADEAENIGNLLEVYTVKREV